MMYTFSQKDVRLQVAARLCTLVGAVTWADVLLNLFLDAYLRLDLALLLLPVGLALLEGDRDLQPSISGLLIAITSLLPFNAWILFTSRPDEKARILADTAIWGIQSHVLAFGVYHVAFLALTLCVFRWTSAVHRERPDSEYLPGCDVPGDELPTGW